MTVNFRAVFKENYMLEFTSMDEFSPGCQGKVKPKPLPLCKAQEAGNHGKNN
jgi:hypothetical protein